MSEALNTIHAYFGAQNSTTTAPVKQWAYGQKLIIHDNALPPVFEAYYSNSKSKGDAKPQIGQDGEVRAPHEYFKSGADIYVFLMQHEGEEDGRYNKVVHIPITPAPRPTDIDPDPEESLVIGELVDAMNNAVAQCEAFVEHYPTVVDGYWYVWDEASEHFVTTGVPATGNGIASARLNSDYTLTLTFTDGTSFTTPISIRGATGDSGVYIGDSAPTDPNQNVWIDTDGGDDMQEIVDAVLAQVVTIVNVSGTDPVIVAEADHRYMCGELTTLSFTPPASGICDIVFTSGSTATVVTIPNTVKFPDGAFSVEANKTYEINVMDGVYGAVISWT